MSFSLLAYEVGERKRDGGETEICTHVSVGKFVHQSELHVYLISELPRISTDETIKGEFIEYSTSSELPSHHHQSYGVLIP